jgi:uncharacterized protein involved in outer membrane biogenesis
MALLRQPIQRNLSALLGAEVTFEKLNLSVLSGSIEAAGVRIAAGSDLPPVLTIARVKAAVAVGRALRGEIVIKSLVIEKPVVTVVRRADGTTNIPRPVRPPGGGSDAAPAPPMPSNDNDDADKSRWTFDVEKLLVVDGELSFSDESLGGYALAAKPVMAELNRAGRGYGITAIADGVRRADTGVEIGTVRLAGTLDGAADLTELAGASLAASVEVASLLKAKVTSPGLRSKVVDITADGAAEVWQLLALVPAKLVPAAVTALSGRVQFSVAARVDMPNGAQVRELNVRATDVIVPRSAL